MPDPFPVPTRTTYSFSCEEAQFLLEDIWEEFEELADCVWKFNEQIDRLWEIEADKIMSCTSPAIAQFRFHREGRKLVRTFPMLLNYSFVTTTVALFERQLRRICDLIQKEKEIPISSRQITGSAITRSFVYLERFCQIKRAQLPDYHAIETMALIRNCIVHTCGYLEEFADASVLEQRIKEGKFLAKRHKHLTKYLHIRPFGKVRRLWFELDYAHLAPCYCRDFLTGLLVATSLAECTVTELS